MTGKPTVRELGIDLAAQTWQRSGPQHGGIEVAFVRSRAARLPDPPAPRPADPSGRTEWVLLRVTGDPDRRVLVFDRHEWECFLDGALNGEFDDAAAQG
ncbi:MAG: DUF397 domain-containing protein [Streptosporangiaceae bacterium]